MTDVGAAGASATLGQAQTARELSPRSLAWANAGLIAVAALTAVAFALRLPGLDQSLSGDELFAFAEIRAGNSSPDAVVRAVQSSIEISPPLYFVLAWVTAKLGDPASWIRVPSLVLGTAVVPLTYALGRRTVGRNAALLAAALATLSPFLVFYASEARPYATLCCFATLSTWCLVRAIDSDGPGWWVGYALSSSAAIWSHYTAVLVLAAQCAWALWAHRARWRPIVIANVAVVGLFLPWLGNVESKGQLYLYGPFRLDSSVFANLLKATVGHPFTRLADIPGRVSVIALAAITLIAAVMASARWFGRARVAGHSIDPRIVLIAILALATPVALLAYSAATGDRLLIPRNVTASVPAALLAFSALICSAPRPWAAGFAIVAIVAVGVGTVRSLDADHRRPPTREAARIVDRVARPGDPVAEVGFDRQASQQALHIYLRKPHPVFQGTDPASYGRVWRRAARDGADIFIVFPTPQAFGPVMIPPRGVGRPYRLVSRWPLAGLGGGLEVRRFAPAGAG